MQVWVVLPADGGNELSSGNRTFANAINEGPPLILPSLQRPQQLHQLIMLPLPNIIDTNSPHLDIIIQQEIEQLEQTVELVVVGVGGEGRVRYGGTGWASFDGFCDSEKGEAAADGTWT